MLKKTLALTLVLVLSLSLSFSALAANTTESGGWTGENEMVSPLYVTVVPTNLEFSLDPIGIASGGTTGQIFSGSKGYVFANKSTVPVMLNIELKVTSPATSGVTFVDDPEDVDTTSSAPTEKNIYLGAQVAATVTSSDWTASISENTISATYNEDLADAIVPLDVTAVEQGVAPQEARKEFALLLNAGNDVSNDDMTPGGSGSDNTPAADGTSLAAFGFYAELTTYNKNWKRGDLSFEADYDFQALMADHYTAKAEDLVAGTRLYGGSTTSMAIGFLNAAGTANIQGGFDKAINKTSTTDVLIPFYFGNPAKTIQSITWASGGFTLPAAQYTTDGNNIKFKMDVGTYALRSSASGTKNVVVTLSDGSTFTFNIILS